MKPVTERSEYFCQLDICVMASKTVSSFVLLGVGEELTF